MVRRSSATPAGIGQLQQQGEQLRQRVPGIPAIPAVASFSLAEHLRHCGLHLFTGCGHLLRLEVPTRLGSLIHDFLASA